MAAVHVIGETLLVAVVVALVLAALVVYGLRAIGVPEPFPWLLAVLLFLVIVFA